MRQHRALIAIPLFWLLRAAAADGMVPPKDGVVWPQWQVRMSLSTATLSPVQLAGDSTGASRLSAPAGPSLFSDYYFDVPGLRLPAATGGLRATSGLKAGTRGPTQGMDTVPYLGLGYTGLSLKGGWGLTADLGLVAEAPGNAGRVGRALFGSSNQSWDAALRDMRFSPVLQLGVNYAF